MEFVFLGTYVPNTVPKNYQIVLSRFSVYILKNFINNSLKYLFVANLESSEKYTQESEIL